MVAHEMRTPLSIISQFLVMLQILISDMSLKRDSANVMKGTADNIDANELRRGLIAEDLSAEDLLSNIELQVNLLLSFVNDLLDSARIDEGFFTLDKTEFSFHKLVHETYLMFNSHAEMQGKKMIYSVHKSMPEAIYGDKTRLQ